MVKHKILYHGTNQKDEILKYGFEVGEVNLYGTGIYFYENENIAGTYGNEIVVAKVKIERPFTFRTEKQKELWNDIYNYYEEQGESFPQAKTVDLLNKKYNYDSFKFKDFSTSRRGYNAWVIFNKNNINVIG